MKINKLLTDEAILEEIGARIARRRLDLQLTQAAVAEQAGVGKRTLERIEAGASAQLSSLVRIFRVLDLLPGLDLLLPESQPSPMALLKHQGKQRQRAPSSRQVEGIAEPTPWTWGDES